MRDEPHPQCSNRFSQNTFCPLIDFTPSASVDKCLEIYEKELAFQLAAALDPRRKLAWCTQEDKCVKKKAFAKKEKRRCFNS